MSRGGGGGGMGIMTPPQSESGMGQFIESLMFKNWNSLLLPWVTSEKCNNRLQ